MIETVLSWDSLYYVYIKIQFNLLMFLIEDFTFGPMNLSFCDVYVSNQNMAGGFLLPINEV